MGMRSTYHASSDKKGKSKILKKTRKAFLIEYGCSFFLLILLGIALFKKMNLFPSVKYLIFGMAMVSLVSAEYSRYMIRYMFTDNKIIIVSGIIKQKKQNVYFHPLAFVPHLNIKQNRIQRLLGYGSVYLKGEARNTFEIKEISSPQKILQLIEKSIENNKRD